jgi:hypothetical protein
MAELERKGRPEFVAAMAATVRIGIENLMDPREGLLDHNDQVRLLCVAAGLHPLLKDGFFSVPDKSKSREWSQHMRNVLISAVKQTEHLFQRAAGPLGRPVTPPAKRQFVSREKDIAHAQFVDDYKAAGAMGIDAAIGPAPPPVPAYSEDDEVDEYLQLSGEEFASDNFSLLKFWAMMAHTHRFPRLARLARRVLCVPGTTSSLDRALAFIKRHLPTVDDQNGAEAISSLLIVSRNEVVATES